MVFLHEAPVTPVVLVVSLKALAVFLYLDTTTLALSVAQGSLETLAVSIEDTYRTIYLSTVELPSYTSPPFFVSFPLPS